MAWILDTYLSTVSPHERHRCTHVVTGKPILSGGSQGREKATGQGVVDLIEMRAKDVGFRLEGSRYFIQGFGNVGSWVARLLEPKGARLVAVEDVSGAIENPDGLDVKKLVHHYMTTGSLLGFDGPHQMIDHDSFMRTEADFFVPAALERQITEDNAGDLNVKMVFEAANGPTDSDGDRILNNNGVYVMPDILCNSGGVIVSYFEWLQNKRSEFWDLEEVDKKLKRKLTAAYELVSNAASEFRIDWRTAAYIVALRHLERVYKERGIFP
jgi:glutamate dehydrogenase (NAD(P)+)